MFRLTCLPARFGDSILLEYGEPSTPHRVLVDGGTSGTRADIRQRLRTSPGGPLDLELLVISHIDRDHIEGILALLEEDRSDAGIRDIWFNGWPHLRPANAAETFGAVQGERLTKRIWEQALPWNVAFDGGPVCLEPDRLPRRILEGGLVITLLSPTPAALLALAPVWEKEVRDANLDPGFGLQGNDQGPADVESFGAEELPDIDSLADSPFDEDDSKSNASSIAFLAEFDGRRVLFAADAPAAALQDSLDVLSPDEPLPIDLFKVSHHGSRRTTNRELLEKVPSAMYAFSTNGSVYKHPDAETVARVITTAEAPELVFNYRSARNRIWGVEALRHDYGYLTRYPTPGEEGIVLDL